MCVYRTKIAKHPKLSTLGQSWYQVVLVAVGCLCIILSIGFALERAPGAAVLLGLDFNMIVSSSAVILWTVFSGWLLRTMHLLTSGKRDKAFEDLWREIAEEINRAEMVDEPVRAGEVGDD